MKEALYAQVLEQLEALLDGTLPPVSNLANASALLFQALPGLNWAGFYLMRQGELQLGPFQGKAACLRIPLGKGVCGTAAAQGQTQVVEDVHAFAGHIACDAASNSEIVVPIFSDGQVVAVLDIDSPLFGRFGPQEQQALEEAAHLLEEIWPREKMV